jgi:hypothetical protein
MTAHVRILDGGPASSAACPDCDWIEQHPRTAPAQDAARNHNQDRHAYPEQTLGLEIEETP